jgi:hypothetical protein
VSAPGAAPQAILVRLPNPLGDAVMATPVLRAATGTLTARLLGLPPSHRACCAAIPVDEFLPLVGRSATSGAAAAAARAPLRLGGAAARPPRAPRRGLLARCPTRRRARPARRPGDAVAAAAARRPSRPLLIERYLRITRLLGVAGRATTSSSSSISRRAAWRPGWRRGAADAGSVWSRRGGLAPAALAAGHFASACDELARPALACCR